MVSNTIQCRFESDPGYRAQRAGADANSDR
jgi:hypothetical protein